MIAAGVERRAQRYVVRPQADLERLLGRAYQGEIDLGRLTPGLRVVASALDERNLCLAQIAAVQLRVPDLPDEIARRSVEAEDLLIKTERGDGLLARGGWDSAEHPRAGVPPNRGWFAPTDMPTQVAQSEEDERAPEEMLDPTAPLRQALWNAATTTLRQLDPSNPQLSYVVGPNWVPSNQDIAGINAEIRNVVIRRVANFVMPGGNLIGEQGGNVDVRILQGGMQAAEHAFNYLSAGGTPYSGNYPGTTVTLPGDAGFVGLRTNSRKLPTVDINIPGAFSAIRLHYK